MVAEASDLGVGARLRPRGPKKESPERSRAPTKEEEKCDNFKSGLDRDMKTKDS